MGGEQLIYGVSKEALAEALGAPSVHLPDGRICLRYYGTRVTLADLETSGPSRVGTRATCSGGEALYARLHLACLARRIEEAAR